MGQVCFLSLGFHWLLARSIVRRHDVRPGNFLELEPVDASQVVGSGRLRVRSPQKHVVLQIVEVTDVVSFIIFAKIIIVLDLSFL